MSLTAQSIGHASIQTVSIATQSILQLISVMILARLLQPIDFGLAAVALAIISIAEMLSEIGIGSAIVQKFIINNEYISSAFFVSFILYVLISLILFFCADFISEYNANKDLIDIIHFLIIPFFLTGMSTIPKGLLLKRQEYKKLFIANAIPYFIGLILLATILAKLGYGVWAILWGQFCMTTVSLLLVWHYAKIRLFFSFRIKNMKQILNFGVGITLARFFNFISLEGDKLILGHTLSLSLLGGFERIYKIASLLSNQLGGVFDLVLFPTFSKIQNDSNTIEQGYKKSLELATILGFTIGLTTPLFSKQIILVVLGKQWIEFSNILMILLFLPIFRIYISIGDSIMRAFAKVYLNAIIRLIAAVFTVVGIYIGSKIGLIGVAIAYLFSSLIISIIIHYFIFKMLNIYFKPLIFVLLQRIFTITLILLPIWLLYFFGGNIIINYMRPVIFAAYIIGVSIYFLFYSPEIMGKVFMEVILIIKQRLNVMKRKFKSF